MSKGIEAEEVRIRIAYGKRPAETHYSLFNPSYVFLMQERERLFLRALKSHGVLPLDTKRILEIGCGTGSWLREFIKWGARPQNINGIDLLSDRVDIARQLCPAAMRIECGSAATLKFPDGCFDLILQSTVFSSILDAATRQQIAREMLRVIKADGAIFWYDFHMNNPRNPDVQGVNKREIFRLFPNCRIDLRRITLAPPLARFLAPSSLLTCYFLERLKIFNSHYLGVIRKS
ncbi:MAG: class I SAM-dependent methyltransferase [Nitrospirales bacterium]